MTIMNFEKKEKNYRICNNCPFIKLLNCPHFDSHIFKSKEKKETNQIESYQLNNNSINPNTPINNIYVSITN